MRIIVGNSDLTGATYWVAVKELKLSYCVGETILITMYTHYANSA